jgi:solute carrier family 36 (proton-coupled amino acid transporter)
MSAPRDVAHLDPGRSGSPIAGSPATRHASIARLSSPVPSSRLGSSPQQVPNPTQHPPTTDGSQLAGLDRSSPVPRTARSALSTALAGSQGRETSITGTPPRHSHSGSIGGAERAQRTNYGSFSAKDIAGSPSIHAGDPEVVKRHLVLPDDARARFRNADTSKSDGPGLSLNDDEFSSLQLQGGDMTRNVYKWAQEAQNSVRGRPARSQSFAVVRPEPEDESENIQNIKVPGGFRRDFLRRTAESPAPDPGQDGGRTASATSKAVKPPPQLFTNNFIEFLTLYGHFAGEELEEDDEVLEPDEYFSSDAYDDADDEAEFGESSALLGTPGRRKRKHRTAAGKGTSSAMNAALLLLKSFVGTGVLFLPRAFLNGGMLFSSLVLLGMASISYLCFILLGETKKHIDASFGDIGGVLYGKWMRAAILGSLVLSQVGFVSAYTVFTAENLQAFVLAVTNCRTYIDIKWMILMQIIVFLPLSLIRDISKLGFTALIADAFILLGLIYLFYYDIYTIAAPSFKLDITLFNPSSWTLLIGTAIFTFEGVGLIIPIQDGMKHPQKFPFVLFVVMIIITVLFSAAGIVSYAAYGSKTKTVVLLNLPQDDRTVNGVQFLYSVAILLSTPLQLFPAIRILETSLFSRSGKYNPYIKWQKNAFRFFLVFVCALIAWGGAGDLDKFVSLVGSFACVPLVYVYPPMLHLKAVARTTRQRVIDYLIIVFGAVGCVYTTVLTVQQWAGGSVHEPGYCDA